VSGSPEPGLNQIRALAKTTGEITYAFGPSHQVIAACQGKSAKQISMPKFAVEVCRIAYGVRTIEVEAADVESATQIAKDKAGNYEFSEKNSEYEIQEVTLVQP
jgi:hypothetical protein